MAHDWQLVIDARRPHKLADFWASALDYLVEDNDAMIESLVTQGFATDGDTIVHDGKRAWATLAAIRHSDDADASRRGTGAARRLLFQLVPESKAGKNRVHVDINVGSDSREAEVARLEGLGASVLARVDEHGHRHVTMADPEGNEFDVQ